MIYSLQKINVQTSIKIFPLTRKMFITKFFALLFLTTCILTTYGQDIVYTITTTNNDYIRKWQGINPNTGLTFDVATRTLIGKNTIAHSSFAIGDGHGNIQSSAAMGINNNGYLYYIDYGSNAGSAGSGAFNLYSIKSDGTQDIPTMVVTAFDVNGSTVNTQLSFTRLGFDKNGNGYIVARDADGYIWVVRFTTTASGGAGTPQVIGKIKPSDGTGTDGMISGNVNSGDIAFDGNGNVYALTNGSGSNNTKIYIISASSIATAVAAPAATNQIPATLKWIVKKSDGTDFTTTVNGLAFSSTGSLYVSASSDGIFFIDQTTVNGSNGTVNIANVYNGNAGQTDLATAYWPSYTALPVVFEETKGMIKGNELLVNWTTSSENNNDRFDIEVSKDGKNFVKAGTVKSKSNNGKSDKALHYNFSIKYNDAKSLLSLSVFAIAFILLAFNRKNKLLVMLVLFAGTSFVGTSCKKAATEQIDINNENKLFVRIVQIDKDSKSELSKIFTAYKAD